MPGKYGNYGDDSKQPRISPVYEKMMVKLARAELIIHTMGSSWTKLDRHLDHVKAAQSLVREAAVHDASDLPERAKANLTQAIDTLRPVVASSYKDIKPNDKEMNYESQLFHEHISKFVTTAAKHINKFPDQEDWDN